jgi:valyl-tRNA synthetase
MDDGLSKAVRKVFVTLYQDDLIYRGNYIINWCHRCHTALADLEVEHEEVDGHLYHIRYPFPDGSGGLVVATTRPETMLGDTAVAIHPEDERYKDITATSVILPLMQREIPIIRDRYVDMEFGTGGLKITPAHDPNDFEIGQTHDLPSIKVIDDDGRMSSAAGRFEGLDRFACRKAVVKALEEEGLLVKIDPYRHSVGHCYRCKTMVEPNLSKQWFVRAKPLADRAIAAVKTGQTRIIPDIWENTYFDWLTHIRDWCISRQIWWGHQIPAWTCQGCGRMVVAMEAPDSCPGCASAELVQETDVLDTWFSSALWPFSTMGWPEQTELLRTFYPTSVLVTGFDILFFWVARMMMMGLYFMGEVPFRDVYVHALVRDEDGQKMSKSKGNVIDPLNVIESYGTDAFRFTLAAFAAQGRDVKMSEKRVEGYRHFVNKLWNAARFALMHVDARYELPAIDRQRLADRWILSRLNRTSRAVAEALDNYRFNEAAAALYKFVWHELCDWYLEVIKPALYGNKSEDHKQATLGVLWRVFSDTVVLLHPIMPFVTEELWHRFPGTEGTVMRATFPADLPAEQRQQIDETAETAMQLLIDLISGIRNIRGEMNIPPSRKLTCLIHCEDTDKSKIIEAHADMIVNLAGLESLAAAASGERPKASATAVVDDITLFVSLEGIVDVARESARLEKEIAKLAKENEGLTKKLANEQFLGKAPADVVDKVRQRQAALLEKLERLQAHLDKIRAVGM